MPKQQLNEVNFINKFINAVFNSIANAKANAVYRAAEKDPEFQKIIRNLERSRLELERWVQQKKQTDPQFAKTHDAFSSFNN